MSPRCRRSGFEYAVLIAAFAFIVPGCAAATGTEDGARGERPEVGREASAPPTTMPVPTTMAPPTSTSPPNIEPPGSTLSYVGETVSGSLGSFCWETENAGLCVDGSIPFGGEELAAPSGANLTFAYQGEELDSLDVSAIRGTRGSGRAEDLQARLSGTRARIVADLPPASTFSTRLRRCQKETPRTASGW
jgi:hypothetical protein